MGFGAFFKGLSLFLQIGLVIAGVIAGAYFLGWLAPVKHKLKDTPVTIKSIKEIGQFITAEYYGEVLSSYRNKLLDEIDSDADTLFIDIEELDAAFRAAIISTREGITETKRNKIKKVAYSRFERDFEEILDDSLFGFYLESQEEVFKVKNEEKFIKLLVLDTNKLELLHPAQFLSESHKQEKIDILLDDKKYKKHQIILLGRGWVKAGFDFGSFSERNFYYDKLNNRIYFFGLKPKILSHAINPWFIPEKNMKGFEIIMATRKSKFRMDQMEATKQKCMDILLEQALNNKILETAKKNAEENLRVFFSLILEKEIESVIFYNESFDYHLSSLLGKDTTLTESNLFVIDSLLYNNQGNPFLNDFIDTLKQLPVRYDDSLINMDRYLPLAASILWGDDGIDPGIDPMMDSTKYIEYQLLKKYRDYVQSDSMNIIDSVWFYSRHKHDSLQQQYDQIYLQLGYLIRGKQNELKKKHEKNTREILFNLAKEEQIKSFNGSVDFILENCQQFGKTDMTDSLRRDLYEELKATQNGSRSTEFESYQNSP